MLRYVSGPVTKRIRDERVGGVFEEFGDESGGAFEGYGLTICLFCCHIFSCFV